MPTIVTLGQVKIRMFAGDHAPPHFHIWTTDHMAVVDLATMRMVRGQIRNKDYQIAMEWAEQNRDILWAAWSRLNG